MVARSGYSIRLFDAVVKEIEHEYQHPLSTVDPLGRLARRSGAALIVHDEEDRFAPTGTPCARPRMAAPGW
jgi:hypothetical protein